MHSYSGNSPYSGLQRKYLHKVVHVSSALYKITSPEIFYWKTSEVSLEMDDHQEMNMA